LNLRWRKLRYAEDCIMRSFITCTIKWGRACNTRGDIRNAYKVLGGKPEIKIPFGRLGRCGRIILEWML